jgi:hypothetical protein
MIKFHLGHQQSIHCSREYQVDREKMDQKEFRLLMFWQKKNAVEAKAWLDKLYLDSAPAKSTVEKWFAKL